MADIGKKFSFFILLMVLTFTFQDVFTQEARDFYRLSLGVELSAGEMKRVIYP